ncbi:MAG: ribosomal protein L7/L12 [Dehalococcoidia bacterium]
MQLRFVLFGSACLVAAIYLSASRGAADIITLVVGMLAIGGFVAARLAAPPGGRRRQHANGAPRPRAVQEQVATLAANLAALADAKSGFPTGLAGAAGLSAYLVHTGSNKIAVIKALRSHLPIGLKEAKDFADAADRGGRPLLAATLTADAARTLAHDVAAAGGRVEIE